MNFKIDTSNYIDCGIYITDDEADGYITFDSFAEAKKEYLYHLKQSKDSWNFVLQQGRTQTEANCEKIEP